jgi:transposase InsO family protein
LFPGPLALLNLPQHLLFMEDIFLIQIVTVCAENLGKESAKQSFPSNSHPILPPRRRRREKKTKICFRSIMRRTRKRSGITHSYHSPSRSAGRMNDGVRPL